MKSKKIKKMRPFYMLSSSWLLNMKRFVTLKYK